jgi:hypothetical protein
MNMTKVNRIVEKSDIVAPDVYAKNRKHIRKELVEYKKNRRIPLGPYATFYFENFKTMLAQIQEMLHIEKGGDEQLKDELNAYNPLIPRGKELVATLMFEIDDPILRANFLGKVGGIEKKVKLNIGKDTIIATPEIDVDRTSAEGKASSVQFLHFHFSDEQIKNFKVVDTKVALSIDHSLYDHAAIISKNTKKTLEEDFI